MSLVFVRSWSIAERSISQLRYRSSITRTVIRLLFVEDVNQWKLFVPCKHNMVISVNRDARSTIGYSASNWEELLYVMTKERAVHRRQPLRVVIVEGILMEEITSIQHRYHTLCKQKANHCPPFLLGAD
ncbi:hypothetical protein TNCV_313231 [Trichonephila clavipes]|nr:hypothetical protein TNCV_313231 [Trichonephila clavipes]